MFSQGLFLLTFLPFVVVSREQCKIDLHGFSGCTCYELPSDSYHPFLECSNLTSVISLQKSLSKFAELKYPLKSLLISDSLLQVLPGSMFKSLPLWQIKMVRTPLLSLGTPDLLAGLEYSLDHLYISGNRFVGSWDFSVTQSLQRLVSITLEDCDLFHIVKVYIDKMPESLSTLYLDTNRIETVEPKAFVNSSINTLSLEKNLIKEIPDDILPDSLSILYIRDNLIEAIPLKLFENSKRLRFLYMDRNQIHTLDQRAFLYINKHYKEREGDIEVYLRYNPLQCCTFSWLADLEIKAFLVGKCASPTEAVGYPLSMMDNEFKKMCRQ